MRGAYAHHLVTMHCPDPECPRFNHEIDFRWAPDCWDHPAEWIDEPECPSCGSPMEENPIDVQAVVEEAAELFNDDWMDWDPKDRAFFTVALMYVRWKKVQGGS